MNIFEYLDAHTAGYNEGVRRTLALIKQIATQEAAEAAAPADQQPTVTAAPPKVVVAPPGAKPNA